MIARDCSAERNALATAKQKLKRKKAKLRRAKERGDDEAITVGYFQQGVEYLRDVVKTWADD